MLASLLLSVLPNFALNGLKAWLDARSSAEETKRSTIHDTVTGIVEVRKAQAAVIQKGMEHKAFWLPWLIAAVPASVWYAWGMLDSAWPGHLPHVAALPEQLKEYTDAIWNNLFLSGSVALGGTAIAKAIARIVK